MNKKEIIFRVWKLVYMKLYNNQGWLLNQKYQYYSDAKYNFDCTKLFWRFYYVNLKTKIYE